MHIFAYISHLCPSGPVLCSRMFWKRSFNLPAALPSIFKINSTHSKNARSMALMIVTMTPKSMACMPSRMSIWCTQKCVISQNALKTRCAPHRFRLSS